MRLKLTVSTYALNKKIILNVIIIPLTLNSTMKVIKCNIIKHLKWMFVQKINTIKSVINILPD